MNPAEIALKKEIMGATPTPKPEFKAAVGLSRKWDAREAGREVARNTLEQLGKDPHFLLLFSTIHYEKHGGFQELLNGVYDILPKETPLIGGTVAGFINQQGCYTRGVTALAANYPNMNVAIGIGHNTRKNPAKAAEELSSKVKISNSKNNLLFCLIPGGTVPSFPGLGRKKVLKSGSVGNAAIGLLELSIELSQLGPGREDEVIEELSKDLENYYILGGSTMDDLNQNRSYQFFNKAVSTTDVVGLNLSSDLLNYEIITTDGLKKTGKTLHITKKSLRNCVIEEIDNKPATTEFLRKINWPEDFLNERLYTKTFYYPLGETVEGVLRPQIIGAFLGNNIACGYSIKTNDLDILSASGLSLVESAKNAILQASKYKIKTLIGVVCATQLETLGHNIYRVYNAISPLLVDTPFIILYCAGEESYSPKSPPKQLYDTFNIASIS
ncbi:FIST N domain protein [uncultured archaeon]|nr:FIST N domain protein [uncultured archaeon]